MNVRRIVMVMLVLVCLVQGVSAESFSVSSHLSGGNYSCGDVAATQEIINIPSEFFGQTGYFYGSIGGSINSGAGMPSSTTVVVFDNPNTYLIHTIDKGTSYYDSLSTSFIITSPGTFRSTLSSPSCTDTIRLGYLSAIGVISTTPPNTASGESCSGSGYYDIYINGAFEYTDPNDGNYSFQIFENISYQINYINGNTSEWHNFTASGSDETWNPSCPGTYTVSGTLLGPDGEGTNNALMALMYVQPPDPDNLTAANTEASYSSSTGEYSFSNIYPGAYFVVACGPGPCYPYGSDWFYVTDSDVTVTNLTYPEKINIRFRVLDSNSTPLGGLYLHLQDAPSDYGGWMSTDADGYTSYNPMYPSAIYVEIVDEDMTTLATTTITGDAQYEYQISTITLPAPDATNTTIPVIPPDSDNSTPPTQPPAGGGDIGGGTVTDPGDYACTNTLTASVQDADHVAIVGAAVKLYPYNSSISGSHSGTTDAAGEYTFPCTNATLSYNVEARATCYEHEISEDEGYSGTAYFHLNKTLTLACGFDDGSGGGGTGTNGTDSGDPDLIAEVTVSDDAMKAPILNYLFGGFLLVIFYMVATFYKKK